MANWVSMSSEAGLSYPFSVRGLIWVDTNLGLEREVFRVAGGCQSEGERVCSSQWYLSFSLRIGRSDLPAPPCMTTLT